MSRFAIGYQPTEAERPVAVFVETADGVLLQGRGEVGARLLDQPMSLGPSNGGEPQASPGEREYFDVILDSFSTRFLIRTVTDLDPEVIARCSSPRRTGLSYRGPALAR